MRIEILATESLGVRGLCCVVEVAGRSILIDPGMAMGYMRHGLMPHPVQVAAGERIREAITAAAREATDMVIRHFHGDHMPLVDANPYQLSAERVRESLRSVRLWTKGLEDQSDRMRQRAESFAALLDRPLRPAEGRSEGCLAFSHPVSHGEEGNGLGTLMMTRVAGDGEVFVHASDVQLLDRRAVARILRWKPTVVLLSGPPLYLELSSGQEDLARELADLDLEFVAVGGGFGVPYHEDEAPLDLDAVADATREALGDVEARLAIEPGRYFVADAGVLLTTVNTVKETPGTTVVGIDAGMTTLLRPAMYDAYHAVRSLEPDQPPRGPVSCEISGPVCETADVLGRDRTLPDPTRGDLLAVGNAGAYGYEMSSQYNSRPRPAVVALDGGEAWVAVRRETLADLTRLEAGERDGDAERRGNGGTDTDGRPDRGGQVGEAAGTDMTGDTGSADGRDERW